MKYWNIYSIIAIAVGIYAAESDMLLLMLHRSNDILIIDYDDGDDRPRTDSEQAPKTEQRPATAQVMSADADDAPRRQMRRSHTRKENTSKFLSVTRCVCVCDSWQLESKDWETEKNFESRIICIIKLLIQIGNGAGRKKEREREREREKE